MKSEGVKYCWQCSECGRVHYEDVKYNIDSNGIYDILYCEQCETETKQLWCGNDILDFYELYDTTKDLRFYY